MTSKDLPASCEFYALELRSTQWATMVDWYRTALGLRSVLRVVDEGYAMLMTGGTRLVILARNPVDPPSPRLTLTFETDNLAIAIERLQAAGDAISEPRTNDEGLTEINTTDPDGNRVRIFSWPR